MMKPTPADKIVKYNSMVLGVAMSLFGLLKFFEPYRTQFDIQITKSGLPRFSIPMGIAGEISIGLTLLSASCFRRTPSGLFSAMVSGASAGLIANMAGASYVHLHPEVPANVLPLKIKPPFIPLLFMSLAGLNLVKLHRDGKQQP